MSKLIDSASKPCRLTWKDAFEAAHLHAKEDKRLPAFWHGIDGKIRPLLPVTRMRKASWVPGELQTEAYRNAHSVCIA